MNVYFFIGFIHHFHLHIFYFSFVLLFFFFVWVNLISFVNVKLKKKMVINNLYRLGCSLHIWLLLLFFYYSFFFTSFIFFLFFLFGYFDKLVSVKLKKMVVINNLCKLGCILRSWLLLLLLFHSFYFTLFFLFFLFFFNLILICFLLYI